MFNKSIPLILFPLSSAALAMSQTAAEASASQYQQMAVEIPRLSSPPEIDGLLKADEWLEAKQVTEFFEFRPVVGDKPDHPTEAYVAYDADYFYVAATIHQKEDSVVDRVLTQGSWIWREDYFGLVLDTNYDKSDAYLFHVTPSGVKVDGMVNGSQWIEEWNTLWYAKTHKTADSWSVEIAIPMHSISFDPTKTNWGLQLRHKKSKPFQDYFWNFNNIQDQPWNAHQLGEISGVENVRQGLGLDVKPSLSVKRSGDVTDTEPAIDVMYKFTSNVTGLLTLNTDFSGTEVDAQDVNMTRFNSYSE
ncbi:hypothetical protein PCIT_b1061 [Pseudoalteromonas citrea]|uniref:Carbohydrate-binding domain-containing protein n=2 Tax=Pseudoalteromonas citrea TaxID=43655 RepID=A0AAD4AFL7_9GAMM|nr:carbohydrate binding family 9 domain-containing protein [Pseudoalteromonas citrea]KAF7764953.1 hypothetical protein PCIT_b1061 [Pseudoalteromonas citrea]